VKRREPKYEHIYLDDCGRRAGWIYYRIRQASATVSIDWMCARYRRAMQCAFHEAADPFIRALIPHYFDGDIQTVNVVNFKTRETARVLAFIHRFAEICKRNIASSMPSGSPFDDE
jgi:hypothetical protein